MTELNQDPAIFSQRSFAVRASWTSLGLAFGCVGLFFLCLAVIQFLNLERTPRGEFAGVLPRTILFVLWAGEGLAPLVGLASFLLIRRNDIASKAIYGIVARSLVGIIAGFFGTIVLWLIVGHVVIGF